MFNMFANHFNLVYPQIFRVGPVNESDFIFTVAEYYTAWYAVEYNLMNILDGFVLNRAVFHVMPLPSGLELKKMWGLFEKHNMQIIQKSPFIHLNYFFFRSQVFRRIY